LGAERLTHHFDVVGFRFFRRPMRHDVSR